MAIDIAYLITRGLQIGLCIDKIGQILEQVNGPILKKGPVNTI